MKKATVTKDRIRQEHEEIEVLTTELFKALAERHVTRQRLLSLLRSLQERVNAHLSDEERGGFFRTISLDDQAAVADCESLCEEHELLRQKLGDLVALADEGTVQAEWWDELEARFHELSVGIARHERYEQQMLRRNDTGK